MKKLFGRKNKDDEPSNPSFGRGDNRTSQNSNPYAQNPDTYSQDTLVNPQDSFAPPRAQTTWGSTDTAVSIPAARPGLPSGPRPGGFGTAPPRQPPQPRPYNNQPQQNSGASRNDSGYSNDKIGASTGFGANRYNASAASYNSQYKATGGSTNTFPSQRQGGYGGFDQPSGYPTTKPPAPQHSSSNNGADWGATGAGHDGYDEDMTEEQRENAQVEDMKQEARDIRQQDIATIDKIEALVATAEGISENSIDVLTQQNERLRNTEINTLRAHAQVREGRAGTKKLQTLNNASMFRYVGGKKVREQETASREIRALEARDAEDEARRLNREAQKNAQAEMAKHQKATLLGGKGHKYTFEDDDGTDAADEDKINDGIDRLGAAVGRLNVNAHKLGVLADASLPAIQRIAETSEKAQDGLIATDAMMRGIK